MSDMTQFEIVTGYQSCSWLNLHCKPCDWWSPDIDDVLTLADLNQRAAEHLTACPERESA